MKTFRDKSGEYRNIFMHFVFHFRDKERKANMRKGQMIIKQKWVYRP